MTGGVLITGASSGIGEAYARRLARNGAPLILVARREARLQALARELRPVPVEVVAADLSREEEVARLEERITAGPPLSMLVSCAGFGTRGHFVEVPAETILAQTRLHVLAPVRLIRAVLPAMVRAGRGAVITVSSLGAFFPAPHYASYNASKAYLNALAEALHAELRESGVRVQVVCAGLTRTEFLSTAEYAGFDYKGAPDWAWMSPEAVVRESLAALESGRPLLIPGLHNRLFVRAMRAPGLGWLLGRAIDAAGIEY